mmetsp:Transcript_38265/g.114571  ORF Transcript_38265/g.114571 Transcript_38265/m.114571 type:complete len:266 (-) Transcript_38265:624-1421(-)
MPLCNLDYLFDLSESSGELEENLIIAWKVEPSQGGFFMLRPGAGELAELEEVIRVREEKSKTLPWPHFNAKEGWGHVIEPPDHWVNFYGKKGREWDWYGVFADQGLLYMWVKYMKKKVSIVVNDVVQNWEEGQGAAAAVLVKERKDGLLNKRSCSKKDAFNRGFMFNSAPYWDFHHFTGRLKPWLGKKAKEIPADVANIHDAKSPTQLWFHALQRVSKEHDMKIDIKNMRTGKPPLGLYPTYFQMLQKRNATMLANESKGISQGT